MTNNEKILILTEKKILAGIASIKNGTKTPAEASIGKMLNSLKNLDETLYEKLMKKYKETLEYIKIKN